MVGPKQAQPLMSLINLKTTGFHKLRCYLELIRFFKPVGTFLLLWPALWGLLLAKQYSWQLIAIFSLGTFLMRSAGCAINDYADRKIDGLVSRTATRPLAAHLIQPWEALVVAGVLAAAAFALVLLTNPLTIGMSFVGVGLATLYPFTKRWISSPQLVLGGAFAWAIPMGYAASLGFVPLDAWLYFLVTLFWVLSYDTYYAMADRADDRFLNIGSTALLFGIRAAGISFGASLIFVLGFSALLWLLSDFALIWAILSAVIGVSLAYRQYTLALTDNPVQCIKAFKISNILGLSLTLVLVLGGQAG